MKTFRCYLLLPVILIGLFYSGCTRVAFKEPFGKSVPDKDLSFLAGDWIGSKGAIWHVEQESDSSFLKAKWVEDDKDHTCRFTVRELDDNVIIVWAEDPELQGYLPFRVSGAEDALALLHPDDKAVERLVKQEKLKGHYEKNNSVWTLSAERAEPVLIDSGFWELHNCMPFVRVKPTDKSGKAPREGPDIN